LAFGKLSDADILAVMRPFNPYFADGVVSGAAGSEKIFPSRAND
jgi:hypothetical protein